MQDKAIEFEATKYKVIKTMNNLKNANLNIGKYDAVYEKIIEELNNDNKTIPESIVNSDTNFATDCLTANYTKAIKQLDLLFTELSKYEIYVQVSSFTNYLKTFINQNYKMASDFDIYRESLIDIINKLLKSNTLDYDVEGNLIEEIYEITYHFIKEEIKVLGYSKTLTILENNEINIHYLDKQITRELETINLKERKYANLLAMKNKIDAQGFNSNYVNEEFLNTLVISNTKPKRIAEIIDSLNEQINNNLKGLDNLDHEIFDLQMRNFKKNKTDKKDKLNLAKQITLLITSLSILGGLVSACVIAPKEKKYKTTKTTYSTVNGITTESIYDTEKEDKTIIYEISPYQKNEFFGDFKRTKTTYDVSKIDDISIEEYLDIDLKELGIKGVKNNENKKELTLAELYDETIRYVEKTTVDTDDYQEEFVVWGLPLIILLCSMLEFLWEAICWETEFNDSEHIALIGAIKNIKKDIGYIKCQKYNNQNIDEDINKLKQKYEKLLIENKDLIKNLINYYENIKNNYEYYDETAKIEKTLKLIKNRENN